LSIFHEKYKSKLGILTLLRFQQERRKWPSQYFQSRIPIDCTKLYNVSHGLQLTECTKSTQDAQARERERERGNVSLVALDERRKGEVSPVAPHEK